MIKILPIERLAFLCELFVGGCAALSDSRIPDPTVQKLLSSEQLDKPFWTDQGTLEPETTGEPERKWVIWSYYGKGIGMPYFSCAC